MSDRHEKWTPVEPGTVIPAGQPYAVQYDPILSALTWGEYVVDHEFRAGQKSYKHCRTGEWVADCGEGEVAWFVDSSWEPPLVLPTDPGSVIEARKGAGVPALWLRSTGYWGTASGAWAESDDLTVIRVLFDAGATA